MDLAGREFTITNGPIATYASGYAIVSLGDTVIMANATISKEGKEGAAWFPMVVDYEENFYAAGKIKGSRFVKRPGRPSENATLISRLIDRPMRPLFPKGTTNEVQIIATALSADLEVDPGTTAINAASMALLLSGAPFAGPVGAVRMGYVNDELIVNPTYDQCKEGKMDLVVAGTKDAITMVEAGMKEVSEEVVLDALQMAHKYIKELCEFQEQYAAKFEIEQIEAVTVEENQDALDAVASFVTDDMLDGIKGKTKKEVKAKIYDIEQGMFEKYAADLEEEKFKKGELKEILNNHFEKRMRHNILTKAERLDGRAVTDVREVTCYRDILPRTHGSAIFQRGETMALTITTLGGPGDAQIVDTMDSTEEDETKRYFHHYHFPPFSTGDIKMLRGAGRREIGHGDLAERALVPVLPGEDEFPYTMWLTSEITRCNGSSSMASVCGSTLSLMAAGVPIKAPVAGIAMGLVMDKESGDYKILTDIQGMEDFAGDMDFKVAGTDNGITSLQMDIKLKGLQIELMREALEQAKEGRRYIMDQMLAVVPEVATEMSKHAPMIMSMTIDPDFIGKVIGKGGETIQAITKECGVEIDITDDGLVRITAPNGEAGNKAKEWIEGLTYVPKVGDILEGPVVKIFEFGALVQISAGTDGLVHISEIANERIPNVESKLSLDQVVKVKVIKVDMDSGKISLSIKQVADGGSAPSGGGGKPADAQAGVVSAESATSMTGSKGGHGEIVEGTTSVRRVNGS